MSVAHNGTLSSSLSPSLTFLASHELPTSLAGGGQDASASASASSASNLTHHLLPQSISPSADLALCFTTIAPPPAASANSGSAPTHVAVAATQSGLSAAQRLIQQRMAAMRARAAAAACLSSGSAAIAGGESHGPIKGQPVEMSLWRVGAEMQLVWKQPINLPEALIGDSQPDKTGTDANKREQETVIVGGMHWSPNGRLIALQVTILRSTDVEMAQSVVSVVALYVVQDGKLDTVTPLQRAPTQTTSQRSRQLLWVTLNGVKSLDRGDVPGSSRYASKKYPGRPPIDLTPIIGLAAASPGSGGSSGGGRFQSLMGGGSALKTELILPSQRRLESDHASNGGEGDKDDLLRGWTTLFGSVNGDQDGGMDVLLATEVGRDGRQGAWLLLRGRLPLVFLPLPHADSSLEQELIASCCIDEQRQLYSTALLLSDARPGFAQFRLTVRQSSLSFLSNPSDLTSLCHLLDLSSRLNALSSQALDLNYLLSTVFQTLKASYPIASGSLSPQQAISLPPVSRLQYALDQLANSHVQSMRVHLITLLCTGIASEMIESLLLNTLVSGKWKSIVEETLKVYEAIEFTASEIGRIVEEMDGCITELRGWSEWRERSRPLLPAVIKNVPLSAHLEAQQEAVSKTRSLAHKIIHYAQGERLAWDEMGKWITWERERVEALNTDSDDQPYTARTFDPLVLIEFVQRDFECPELHWLLLGVKSELKRGSVANAESDESISEEKIRPTGPEVALTASEERKMNAEDIRKQLEQEDEKTVEIKVKSGLALQACLRDTLRWLQDDSPEEIIPPQSSNQASHPSFDNEPPRLFEGDIVANRHTSLYADVPLGPRLRHIVKALKAIFINVPERLSGQETNIETITLPLNSSWLAAAEDQVDNLEQIISLPSRAQRQTDRGGAAPSTSSTEQAIRHLNDIASKTRSVVFLEKSTGETIHQVVLGSADRRKLLCVRIIAMSASDGEGLEDDRRQSRRGTFLELHRPFDTFEMVGHEKLLLITKEADPSSVRSLQCLDLPLLFQSLALPLERWQEHIESTATPTPPPEETILMRQILSSYSTSSQEVVGSPSFPRQTRQLAVSTTRNMTAVLTRHRHVKDAGAGAGATEEYGDLYGESAWLGQRVDYWDLVAAEDEQLEQEQESKQG